MIACLLSHFVPAANKTDMNSLPSVIHVTLGENKNKLFNISEDSKKAGVTENFIYGRKKHIFSQPGKQRSWR